MNMHKDEIAYGLNRSLYEKCAEIVNSNIIFVFFVCVYYITNANSDLRVQVSICD